MATPAMASPGCHDGTAVTYTQKVVDGGDRVVMEAERPTTSSASVRAGHGPEVAWEEFTTNQAGNGAYVRIPTTGNEMYDLPADGARLNYEIDFLQTGTYYVHFRYRADSDADNSVRLSLDGNLFLEAWHLDVTNTEWVWGVAPVTMSVTSTGIHTFTVHQREDGLYLDRIIITSTAGASYYRFGPNVTETVYSREVKGQNGRISYSEDSRTGHGILVMEAEEATNTVYGSRTYECRNWVSTNDTGASGGKYMTTAEAAEISDSSNFRQAPRLDFELEIGHTGNHYIHLRHKAMLDDNSVWITINDRLVSAFHLDIVDAWQWQVAPELFAASAGEVVIMSIYMREDYTPIDKIIVTTDPAYAPSGLGQHTTIETPPDLVYKQSAQVGNIVELPMETPSRNRAGTGQYEGLRWAYVSDATAEGRKYAIVENDAADTLIMSGARSDLAPLQEFDINFVVTGTHYLYVRHAAPNGSNNSFTYYLDGIKIREQHLDELSPNAWTTYYSEVLTIEIPTTGLHVLGIALREDGTPIDHFTLTTTSPYAGGGDMSLPISLTDFTAEADGATNLLEWTSSYEADTDFHRVERSHNGTDNWEVIGTVAAAGNSDGYLDYRFTDEHPIEKAYYRLTTVDLDGTESTSSIVSVIREPAGIRLSVYPNPATDRAVLTFEHRGGAEALLRLTSLTGQVVATRPVAVTPGRNTIDIPLDRFTPGTYILSLMLSGEWQTQRIVVTR
ncbi:hypothetical protein GGR26_002335 [Lewinella marina]|uniref:T9SS type A sorting domain-containing protein n=1 Tax=Neolewinella marina TaxID=438751 RepID=UPI001431F410|nr:T9SS type A sorting domain-containing protein [Neolewinella marina]NJB86567.1 hypothetical protein [Neolewinella marina]